MTQPPGWNPGYGGGPLPPPLPTNYPPRGAVPPPPPPPMYRPQQPPPGYGQPPPMQVMPPPYAFQGGPPPRRPSRGPIVAMVLVAVAVLGLGTVGVVALTRSAQRSSADSGSNNSQYTATGSPTTTSRTTTTTTSRTSTSRPTSSRTTSKPSTSSAPAGPQPVNKTGDNPLFAGSGLSATNCQLSRWSTDPAGAEQFFRSALPCLDAAWAPVLKAAKLPFFSPKLAFPNGTNFSSPCGAMQVGRMVAYYCGGDNTLYMPFSGLQTEQYGAHPGVYLALFAHEYGHHVQQLSGVMDAYGDQRYDAGSDSDAGLELSRRLELQAQCFSGMFLASTGGRGAVDSNLVNEALTSQDRGDHNGPPRDHGTDDHAIGWWKQGYQKNSLAQCNTWRSNPPDVS